MTPFLINIPDDHLIIFKQQALLENISLSEWIDNRCKNALSFNLRKSLSISKRRKRRSDTKIHTQELKTK